MNYVGVGADAKNILAFTGASNVLTAIRYDYLWNHIRVKGGAYGSLYTHRRNGNFALGLIVIKLACNIRGLSKPS